MKRNAWRALGLILAMGGSSFAQASDLSIESKRDWRRVPIEGAKCGDGLPYSVFISPGDPRKVAFDFMGGGACWNGLTCFGPLPLTWIHPLPGVLEFSGILSSDPRRSPIADYTVVYFPYCTGDVHLGSHRATYWGLPVHHFGKFNFEKALKWLTESPSMEWSKITHFVSYGFSAGAIGALVHSATIDKKLPPQAERVLIADAPGLHFGPAFWDKFTPDLLSDFREAMKNVGYSLKVRDRQGANEFTEGTSSQQPGNLAGLVPQLCRKLPNWRVGVLQGSLDLVMSKIFGEVTLGEHERMVYGPHGVYQLTQNLDDQCAAFVPRTPFHTFLVMDQSADLDATGKTAREFMFDQVRGPGGVNYR